MPPAGRARSLNAGSVRAQGCPPVLSPMCLDRAGPPRASGVTVPQPCPEGWDDDGPGRRHPSLPENAGGSLCAGLPTTSSGAGGGDRQDRGLCLESAPVLQVPGREALVKSVVWDHFLTLGTHTELPHPPASLPQSISRDSRPQSLLPWALTNILSLLFRLQSITLGERALMALDPVQSLC